MITEVSVDGFRSLDNFSLKISPGLNVLIGPNGSGKSNIIALFHFLSLLSSYPVNQAISLAGGIGKVFRKANDFEYVKQLSFTVRGEKGARSWGGEEDTPSTLFYEYTFQITFELDENNLFFSKQILKLEKRKESPTRHDFFTRTETKKDKWSLIARQEIGQDSKISNVLEKSDFRKFKIRGFMETPKKDNKSRVDLDEYFKEYGLRRRWENPTQISFLSALSFFRDIEFIARTDFGGGATFNIVPEKVKDPEDLSSPPRINPDGTGLAATIFYLQNPESSRPVRPYLGPPYLYGGPGPRIYARRAPARILESIIKNTKLINKNFLGLIAEPEKIDNKIRLFVKIKTKNSAMVLPLNYMSEGTIKWLCLVTAIFTGETILAIEEPENFLHPLMQTEIINLIRESSEKAFYRAPILLTTHSETLINACKPEEVILIQMKNNVTSARRPKSKKDLENLINESGLGIGHWYIRGALKYV